MEIFTVMPFGEQVDLDDLKIYEGQDYKDFTTHELWDECIAKIGYIFMYINYFHGDINFGSQKARFEAFCFWFAREERNHRFEDTPENRLWFMKFLFRIDSESENMC